MTENLSEMVKQDQESIFPTENLDLPEEVLEESNEEVVEESDEEVEVIPEVPVPEVLDPEDIISVTNLSDWIHTQVFENLRLPTVTLQGIDPRKQLIIISIDESKDEDEQRKIFIFDHADTMPVLDYPATEMQVCQNNFKIIYPLEEGISLKSYRIRQGLTNMFCNIIDGMLIPYASVRLKKSDTGITEIPVAPTIEEIQTKLNEPANMENLIIRYKQFNKAENIETNRDAIKWLTDRQAIIEDVNHHIQIDNVIITTLEN